MIYTAHVSQAILNSRAIDFLVTLHLLKLFVHEDSQWGLYGQSWLSGELKLGSKTNQFFAQNNVNMKWLQN